MWPYETPILRVTVPGCIFLYVVRPSIYEACPVYYDSALYMSWKIIRMRTQALHLTNWSGWNKQPANDLVGKATGFIHIRDVEFECDNPVRFSVIYRSIWYLISETKCKNSVYVEISSKIGWKDRFWYKCNMYSLAQLAWFHWTWNCSRMRTSCLRCPKIKFDVMVIFVYDKILTLRFWFAAFCNEKIKPIYWEFDGHFEETSAVCFVKVID